MVGNSPNARDIRDKIWPEGAVLGDADRCITAPSALDALKPNGLSFLSRPLTEERLSELRGKLAGVTLICEESAVDTLRGLQDTTLIVVPAARLAFMRAVKHFFAPARPPAGVHPTTVVDETAQLDPSASIGPFCLIGPGCVIGAECVIGPNVSLMQDVRLGSRVTIAGGTVIGADGFGYERNEIGELEKFPHVGGVVIGDDVEIGSNTSIDRGTLNPTIIGARARIDNQVHVAHNVIVGEDVAIIAEAMIGGSVKIGDRAWIAPSATIMNQVTIGADAVVGLGAVVVKPVPDGMTVMGAPAQADAEFRRTRAALKRLADAD
ncbi:UDP-3-O-(3-hydroxymyristoyl)glucosamine N-acyltransferase [Sphingomonas cannabina]|uniref:UDP-3-O-(3-hydroxymyristoyl)glucosamine N-acyltransferase n=1 Tax=Sphingomonas cannabina TaxID=2899123 RepID=UPI001F3B85B9|nr:UDP-3-O-(3-hydroxymyristoyl)glucosamine N-acyltransferase [Sphingomonas cannabina]UIJ44432.1 UDP-3-O-(3-hydroxymyristoyl)glucosamine N-acyltransferase [Sphingomonas cannabina]